MKTIVGLMSGTSVDAIDAVIMQFSGRTRLKWKLIASRSMPWPTTARAAILDACKSDYPLSQLTVLNYALGEYFGHAVCELCDHAGIPLAAIDAVASHGQTIWHQPAPVPSAGLIARGTMQIGEASVIAQITGCTVISDFRTGDLAAGGQGAPLVPWWDWRIMTHRRQTRIIQNIGGIANATFLPASGSLGQVVAFDTGPGNMVIDQLMTIMSGGQRLYDDDGAFAAQGVVHRDLLKVLLEHPFFAQRPPRSTGRELFGSEYAIRLTFEAKKRGMSDEDLIATVTELTAVSIADSYRRWLPITEGEIAVILGGGGARNGYLVERLKSLLPAYIVSTHDAFSIPSDYREAMAFALLGYERLNGQCSNVPTATGARLPVSLGKVTLPPDGTYRRAAV